MQIPHSTIRSAAVFCVSAFAVFSLAAQPGPAVLDAVELTGSASDEIRILLEIRGRVDRVESMTIEDGRFVFDLAPVVWDGPSRRLQPAVPGIREYRWAQYSRDPPTTRFVVEAAGGWSCRNEAAPGGLLVICGGPPVIGEIETAAVAPDIAVVRGIGLTSPVEGLDAEGLIENSLAFVPRDMVRDGLPNFGAIRDDWLGEPRTHKGLDIYGDRVFVLSAADGKVGGVGQGEKAGGWVKIRHGGGVETVYVHVTPASVKIGDKVAKGQRIAVVDGATGNAVQAQLHFEIKLDGRSVDPVPFIFEMAPDALRSEITAALERLAILERERAARVELEYDR